MTNRDVAKAQIQTLGEWAHVHERSGREGGAAAGHALRLAARAIGRVFDIPKSELPLEPHEPSPDKTDISPDLKAD